MAKYSPTLDRVFFALSDPTRRRILDRLTEGQCTVGELAAPTGLSPSGFSKHLRVLERAGLLRQHKRGRERFCEILIDPIDDARSWLDAYRATWTDSLDSFARYAESLQVKKNRRKS